MLFVVLLVLCRLRIINQFRITGIFGVLNQREGKAGMFRNTLEILVLWYSVKTCFYQP